MIRVSVWNLIPVAFQCWTNHMPKKHTHTHRCLKTQNDPVDPIKHFRSTLMWTQVLHSGRQSQSQWFYIWFCFMFAFLFIFYVDSLCQKKKKQQNENSLISMDTFDVFLSPRKNTWELNDSVPDLNIVFSFCIFSLNANLQISGSVPCFWREQTAFCFSLLFFFSFVKHNFENMRAKMLVPLFRLLQIEMEMRPYWCTEWTESKIDRLECFWCYRNELKEWVQMTPLISGWGLLWASYIYWGGVAWQGRDREMGRACGSKWGKHQSGKYIFVFCLHEQCFITMISQNISKHVLVCAWMFLCMVCVRNHFHFLIF